MAPTAKCDKCGEYSLVWAFVGNECIKCVRAELLTLRATLAQREEEIARFKEQLESADKGWIAWQEKAGEWQEKAEAAHQRGVAEGVKGCLTVVNRHLTPTTAAVIERFIGELFAAPVPQQGECEWKEHKGPHSDGLFHTSCGRSWDLSTDEMKFCPFCSKPTKVKE